MLVWLSACTVLHVLVVGGLIPREGRPGAELLQLPAGGFELVDLADGSLAVILALMHGAMIEQLGCRSWAMRRVHAVLASVLVLAQGGHMMVNPLDEWMNGAADPESIELYRTIYWQHEYMSHALFGVCSIGMLVIAAWNAEVHTPAGPVLLLAGLLHGFSFGLFVIGTRCVAFTVPVCTVVVVRSVCLRAGGGGAWAHCVVVCGAMLLLHLGWMAANDLQLPTFDDLSGGEGLQALAAAEYANAGVGVWTAPLVLLAGLCAVWVAIGWPGKAEHGTNSNKAD